MWLMCFNTFLQGFSTHRWIKQLCTHSLAEMRQFDENSGQHLSATSYF